MVLLFSFSFGSPKYFIFKKTDLICLVKRRGMSKKRGGIPDRWLDYHPVGQRVAGTRFIAFKVPLKEALCSNLGCQDWFTPRSLMEQVPKLGLVVDLTFTTRYYFSQVFERQGIAYQKVLCPGNAIPPKDLVHRFYTIVDQFIKQNPNSDSLIGVHCTHGLNRTSFFICSYMVERMGMPPQDAITEFQKARGYDVERKNYIQELLTLKPCSAPSLDELEALYSTRKQPSFNKKIPLPCNISQPEPYEISHRKKKVTRQMMDNPIQRPVPTNYYNSHQYNGHYQRYQRDFESKGSNFRCKCSHFIGGNSNIRGECSHFTGTNSNFRGRGFICRGGGSNSSGRGSNFRGEGSNSSGRGSNFRGEGSNSSGRGSNFRGEGSNFRGRDGSNIRGEGRNASNLWQW